MKYSIPAALIASLSLSTAAIAAGESQNLPDSNTVQQAESNDRMTAPGSDADAKSNQSSATGLDRADETAGEQGRENARAKQQGKQDEEGDSAAMEASDSDAGGTIPKSQGAMPGGHDAGDAEAGEPPRHRAVE